MGTNSQGQIRFVLKIAFGFILGGWLAISSRALCSSNFELSKLDEHKLFYEFGRWILLAIGSVLGAIWQWQKKEKEYLEANQKSITTNNL